MPNDCKNIITITFKKENSLNDFINIELRNNNFQNILTRGRFGIIVEIITAWLPDFDWLKNLLISYPECWIKNEWHEEGGMAGVWIAYMENEETIIKQMNWHDLSIEDEYFIFGT